MRFNSKPDFAEGFGGDFSRFSDRDPIEVDNNGLSSDNVGTSKLQYGIPLRKHCRNKPLWYPFPGTIITTNIPATTIA
ncbi:14954_t:CDS:2 [Funneliformis mosseae]|uniref:14954_t:CDS:1 n=1 Tax=Funneliformis mosseae TaxID=27381 RepID=A0A9N9H4V3_FUNMO|nr:14954_t:CDS:2 [Funneliformis mosseae]